MGEVQIRMKRWVSLVRHELPPIHELSCNCEMRKR